MTTYYYKATNSQGKVESGQLEVGSKQVALDKLAKLGLFPISVSEEQQRRELNIKNIDLEQFLPSQRISGQDVLDFTDKLSTLLRSGLPLARALNLLIETTAHEPMRDVIKQVLKDVSAGKSLSESLGSHPKVFERLFVNMVRAGEAAGVLEQILENLRDYLQKRQELKSFLISAMIYPAILLLTGLGTVLVMVMFVLPRFQAVFDKVGIELPFVTQFLVQVTSFLAAYKWPLALAVIAAVIAFRQWTSKEEGRLKWDQMKMKAPLVGSLITQIEVTRFANALGILLKSSVSLLEAMNIVKDLTDNRVYQKAMDPIIKGIKKGDGMSLPMVQSGVFPKIAVHLVTVGEETGRLGDMFQKIAVMYQANLEKSMKRFIALFEPVMILCMFVVVGLIVAAMLLAVTSLSQTAM
ncbi:MAG: type II secretion system F family protein [Acidobacteria bacterium]|nr:type II secretion system F family protein [Acidobacteriota bacterium]